MRIVWRLQAASERITRNLREDARGIRTQLQTVGRRTQGDGENAGNKPGKLSLNLSQREKTRQPSQQTNAKGERQPDQQFRAGERPRGREAPALIRAGLVVKSFVRLLGPSRFKGVEGEAKGEKSSREPAP